MPKDISKSLRGFTRWELSSGIVIVGELDHTLFPAYTLNRINEESLAVPQR